MEENCEFNGSFEQSVLRFFLVLKRNNDLAGVTYFVDFFLFN